LPVNSNKSLKPDGFFDAILRNEAKIIGVVEGFELFPYMEHASGRSCFVGADSSAAEALDRSKDVVGGFGPSERFWIGVTGIDT
jgi:hypothetical protein